MKRRQELEMRNTIRRSCAFIAVVFLVLIKTSPCLSKEDPLGKRVLEDRNAPWQITANQMSYSSEDSLYTAEGDVVITRDNQVLSADKAIYNQNTGIVQVSGNVRLEANGDLLTGEMGIFDLKSHQGQLTGGSLFIRENNVHIQGSSMMRLGPNTYVVRGCRMTTCDGDNPDWSITGSEVKVTLEGYGQVRHVAFRIRNFPVFYIPYAIFPVKTKRQTGLLLPRLSLSDRNGFDTELPFFWAISDQADATFYMRYMTKRGFMPGLELRYLTEEDSKGVFLFDILSDKIASKDLSDAEEVDISPFARTNKTRYWLRSRSDQKLPGNIEARLDTDFVSDQDYLKEFRDSFYGTWTRTDLAETSGRPVEDIYSPTRRSALRLSHDGNEYSLQGMASYHQRIENPPHDDTPQPLLGLNFSSLSRSLPGVPVFIGVDSEYDRVWRDVGRKGHSIFLSPEATYPVRLGRHAEIEQSFRVMLDSQWLDSSCPGTNHLTRHAYESKTRVSTILEKIFDLDWRGVTGLKHKITPSLTYTYRGYRDRDHHRPWFEAIDEEGRGNIITFALENILDARTEDDKGVVSYSQWGSFTLAQSYDLDEARRVVDPGQEKQPLGPLQGTLTLAPFSGLYFSGTAHWDHYENTVSLADIALWTRIRRSGGRADIFSVDYLYEENGSNSLNCNLLVNLDYGFSAGTSFKRDFNSHDNLETIYWVDYASQCWAVRLAVQKMDEETEITLTFRLPGFGELGSK